MAAGSVNGLDAQLEVIERLEIGQKPLPMPNFVITFSRGGNCRLQRCFSIVAA
jgi:hypothetical protein